MRKYLRGLIYGMGSVIALFPRSHPMELDLPWDGRTPAESIQQAWESVGGSLRVAFNDLNGEREDRVESR